LICCRHGADHEVFRLTDDEGAAAHVNHAERLRVDGPSRLRESLAIAASAKSSAGQAPDECRSVITSGPFDTRTQYPLLDSAEGDMTPVSPQARFVSSIAGMTVLPSKSARPGRP
jgi:hypothetical protein